MNLSNEYDTIKQTLITSSTFRIIMANERRLVATRRSVAPRHSIFRLLMPRTHVVITDGNGQSPIISVRPDPLAIFMVIMLMGGVSIELFMDRSVYPREYPPELISRRF